MSGAVITTETLGQRIARVLQAEFGHLRMADKHVARAAGGATPRAARNWMTGDCPPNSATLVTLMRECPALREEINRILDGEP